MVTPETCTYTEAWLGRTIGTIIHSVSSNSFSGAHSAFFLASVACFTGDGFLRKVTLMESAHGIGANHFWWIFSVQKGGDDFFLIVQIGYGVL